MSPTLDIRPVPVPAAWPTREKPPRHGYETKHAWPLFASGMHRCGHPSNEQVADHNWLLPVQQRCERSLCAACSLAQRRKGVLR